MARHNWDPVHYLSFAGERGRPFVELLQRIEAERPATVVDLGCGPGNLTSLLADRWPEARILGLDSSPEMIAKADDPRIAFEVADVREWVGRPGDVDVIVTNATLQWVPGHLRLLSSLIGKLAPGGWFACQVPGNFTFPSHAILYELEAEEPYAEFTRDLVHPSSHEPTAYFDALVALGCEADVWETTYLHVLTGDDPVFTWISGTGARPTLQALPDELRPRFEQEYKRRLRAAYPARDGRVVLPFRRIFMVARTSA